MQVSIAVIDPPILAETAFDEPFLVRTVELQECVCVRAQHGFDTPAVRRQTDQVFSTMLAAVGIPAKAVDELRKLEKCIEIVVVGCRVKRGEPGHVRSGTILLLQPTTPVQLLEAAERPAFRARTSVQAVPVGAAT